jgi:hypothetical protein
VEEVALFGLYMLPSKWYVNLFFKILVILRLFCGNLIEICELL